MGVFGSAGRGHVRPAGVDTSRRTATLHASGHTGLSRIGERVGVIPSHGGYRKLRSFQAAQTVYDATVVFCDRFVDRRSRTHDQMVQAARSGVQNIAEGSVASATSKKTELKLTGVARASLEELLLDYEDFLRQRGLKLWRKDDPRAQVVRQQYRSESSDKSDRPTSTGS